LLHQQHVTATPAFWVKAVVHLVRLVKTDEQQISQADWQQLKECLMYLAKQQQEQQQQQQQQQLQGEIDGLLPSCLVILNATHVARAESVSYSTVQLYVSHAFDARAQLCLDSWASFVEMHAECCALMPLTPVQSTTHHA
jgi:hypothetical protein